MSLAFFSNSLRACAAALAGAAVLAGAAYADAIDDVVTRHMAINHVPGAAVAIVRDGRIEALRGYGEANVEWGASVGADTAFQLASATKLITGVILMRMAERGEISLDASLDTFFSDAPDAWRRISVRQLATHTSGLSDALPEHPETVAGVVAAAMTAPLAYEPGAESRYGFTDFVVLRAILEQVSGRSFPELVQSELVTPLGLQDTGFNFERDEGPMRVAAPLPRRASLYAWRQGAQNRSGFVYGQVGYAAGGLFSSARDLAAIFVALDQGRLISAESILELETPALLSGGGRGEFGIGWSARRFHGVEVGGHSGGPALADILRVESLRLTVIVLTNQHIQFPLLAEALTAPYLPAEPPLRGMRDRRPALTRAMLAALAEAAAGAPDPSRFNEVGQRDMLPFLREHGLALLQTVGPARGATLVSEREEAGVRTRRYAIEFRDRRMYWLMQTDAEDKIAALYPVADR